MKKKPLAITLFIAAVLIVTMVYAQTKPTQAAGYQYCEFTWTYQGHFYDKETKKSGEIFYGNDQSEVFNKSLYDGLNYLGSKGWELCTFYNTEGSGNGDWWYKYTYTFKKKL